MINFEDELSRQNKKLLKLTNERNSLESRLNNEKFMQNAKEELINQTKTRIDEIIARENVIKELIENLKQ